MKSLTLTNHLSKTQQLVVAALALFPIAIRAQTVDIAEFFLIEPGHTWEMSGTASWSFLSIPVVATVVTEAGETMHGTETTKLTLNGSGSAFMQSLEVKEVIQVSLSSTHMLLHSRVGQVFLNGSLEEEDVETYTAPAAILPRLITVGESYLYTADLDSGSVDDSVQFESIETIQTAFGQVETIKLVVFSDGDVPVTLWLGRNVGYMQANLTTMLDGSPLSLQGNLTNLDKDWNPGAVQSTWADTIAYSDGWRYSDWLGYFWTSDVDSLWINHLGLNWMYCIGNSANLWMYLQDIGWFWSNGLAYPWMFDAASGKYLMNLPGSLWFWDPDQGAWIELTPGG